MRVLVTGMTPTQVGSTKTPLKLESAPRAWATVLKECGYEVEHRSVCPGEDLSGYQKVFIGLSKPDAIAAGHMFSGLWAMHARPDAVLYVDDWQTSVLQDGFKTMARDPVVRLYRLGRKWREEAKEHHEAINGALQKMAWDKEWPDVLIPVIGDGGDLSRFDLPARRIITADPSWFFPRYEVKDPDPRQRKWIYASLLRNDRCLAYYEERSSWPVVHIGKMERDGGHVGVNLADGYPRIPAPEMLPIYARNWGLILQNHPCSGTGWWRPRFAIAGELGVVASCCPEDAALFGPAMELASDPANVCDLNDEELADLSRRQYAELLAIRWPKERTLEFFTRLVEG